MKLIEKKVAAPELIWGNKYVTTSDTYHGSVDVGTEVLLMNVKPDNDGDVAIETEDDYDFIKPEYLQPVAVNAESKVAPKLVVGQKYRITRDPSAGSFPKGTVVTFRSTGLDSDGDIKIYSENDVDWIEPQYLQPVDAEVSAETTYTVELDEVEATVIRKALGKVTERAVSGSGELYTEFWQLLEGGK